MPAYPFIGRIPEDRRYCRAHDMWVMAHEDGVLIGATSFGVHLAGEIIAFTSKPDGAEILRGRGMGTIECYKTVLAVHAPVPFRLIAGNSAAEAHPALINTDPYGAGWMARGLPFGVEDEQDLLCSAAEYREHILSIDPEARFEN